MTGNTEDNKDNENMDNKEAENVLYCSFCGKSQHQVIKLIAGASVYICNECVDLCNGILEEEQKEEVNSKLQEAMTSALSSPIQIFEFLSDFITGQEQAKKALSVAIFLHHSSVGKDIDYRLIKQNIMMLGPTGSGKTYLLKTLATALRIPIAIVSATSYTQAGYVGEDVENIFTTLLARTGGDVSLAQRGIVFIDEIDKIARHTSKSMSFDRDVSGIGVQQALLTTLEGAKIQVPRSRRDTPVDRTYVEFDTSNILFVCSGAFVGLTEIIEKRIHSSALMRHDDIKSAEKHPLKRQDQLLSKVIVEDLIVFGFIPEFAGRFTQYICLRNLYKDDLLKIVTNKNDSILKRYQKYFEEYKVKLNVEDSFIEAIADIALEIGTGARGIKLLISQSLTNLMFELPTWRHVAICRIDKEFLLNAGKPKLYSKHGIPVMLERTKVFISYSHQDSDLVDELIKTIKPLAKTREIDVWCDKEIKPGENWKDRINDSMARTKVAVLLISSDFLASDYAMQELMYFLDVQEKEKITVLWVLVSSCLYDEYKISEFQAVHDIKKTIERMGSPERKDVWVKISKIIKDTIEPLSDLAEPE